MSNIFDNSIWPNAGGTLGQNKVQIPDGVTLQWPEGDALVGNFVFNEGNLVGFVDTKALIANDSKTTTFPYDYVNIQVDKSLEGVMTFNGCAKPEYLIITYTESGNSGDSEVVYIRFEDMSEETKTLLRSATTIRDNVLYDENDNVIGEFNTDTLLTCHNVVFGEDGMPVMDESTGMPKTIDGKPMDALFLGADIFTQELKDIKLVTFDSDLSSLTNGQMMFTYCLKLTSFSSDLSSLTNGAGMFQNAGLTSWNIDLPNLTNGESMFSYCYGLRSWNIDLSNLTNGAWMFGNSGALNSFHSNLSSLTNGEHMFYGCCLDTASVRNIADTINTFNGIIHIGIDNWTPNEQEEEAFNIMVSRGWTVYVNNRYEYTPTSPAAITTLDENCEETVTPIPYWAKPVQTDEKHAKYVDSEGNFYNILGGNYIYGDNLETYGMFVSEEDAAANMRLTKVEKTPKGH